ncbi:MAG: GGDEF domain-containing protein [Bradyrhizobium sp.]|nr:GGDEF domain-containing protein [Bradyrhizobium sp.]
MLNIPTLWTVFVVNFLALGLFWTYLARSFPKFHAAPFWAGSSFFGAAGAAAATLHFHFLPTLLPLWAGGTMLIFSACLATLGIKRFYGQSVRWRGSALITGSSAAAIAFFIYGYDSTAMRIFVYSLGEMLPLMLSLKLLLSSRDGRNSPGARLAGIVTIGIIALYSFRAVGYVVDRVGDFSIANPDPLQSLLTLALMFLWMIWNFSLLLMAIDRLRNDVADLALLDDLTGVGNRRHLLQRLSEECARSERSNEPFALLAIDLDGFKGINDTHGHATGDACLQHFTLMAQTRLRPSDMLARSGGDEFCVVLPASSAREGATIARRILAVCRADAEQCVGADVPVAVSIGVAQWTEEIGAFPDRLIAAADQALYEAKRSGRNCYAVHGAVSPPLAPDYEALPEQALPKTA